MILLDNTTKPWIDLYKESNCVKTRNLIKKSFKDLVFKEGPHIYTLYGKQVPSVSSMVELFVEPFDSKGRAQGCYEKYFNNPSSQYYQMTPEQIEKSWRATAKTATDKGTTAHGFGESCMHYFVGDYKNILPEYRDRLTDDGKFIARDGFEIAIAKFWQDLPDFYVPILAENKVYGTCGTNMALYAGTFDLLVYAFLPDGREGPIMFDWKTNADLYKNFKGQMMLKCLSNLKDTPKNHYEVQQSLYENALNEIGINVLGKRLIWIKNSGEYEVVRLTEKIIPLITEEIKIASGVSLDLPF